MRKERLALAEGIVEQLHAVETAMHNVMTEYSQLGVAILAASAEANLSPLVGKEVVGSHAAGHDALARFMSSMVDTHAGLRQLGGLALPGIAFGDTVAIPKAATDGEDASRPRLVASRR